MKIKVFSTKRCRVEISVFGISDGCWSFAFLPHFDIYHEGYQPFRNFIQIAWLFFSFEIMIEQHLK